tara:strand:- start:1070 stop:1249 length:180 start_codon:yes stop_codon:yes gene_type:complete
MLKDYFKMGKVLLLYTEKQLEDSYKEDCKERSSINLPWLTLEDYRDFYEETLSEYYAEE